MKDKNILILGATGLVGVYTAVTLKAKGYTVYAAAHRSCDNVSLRIMEFHTILSI